MIGSISSSNVLNQMAEMRQRMFSKIDTNGDGKHDKDELAAMVANGPNGGPSVDEIISQFDTDGDGAISQAEFEAQGPMGPPPGVDDMFSALDADGDGSISKTEFDAMFSQGTGTSSVKATDQAEDFIQSLLDSVSNQTASATSSSESQNTTSSVTIAQMLSAALKTYIQLSSASFNDTSSQGALGSALYA